MQDRNADEAGRGSRDDAPSPDDELREPSSASDERTGGLRSVLEVVGDIERLVDELTSFDPAQTEGHLAAELSHRVHRAMDRVRAQQIGWLGRVDAESAWLGSGARSCKAWLVRTHDIPFHEANQLMRSALAWRDTLPATARAARAGSISTAKGGYIAAVANTPDRIAALTEPSSREPDDPAAPLDGPTGEQVLLGLADGYRARDFQKLTQRFSHVADPEADERGYTEALAREHFDLAKTTGGYHVAGFLTLDHGQVLKTALRAVGGVPAAGDTRTASQRRAAELVSLGRLVLDKGLTGKIGTVRPHVSVHVSATELTHLVHRADRAVSSDPCDNLHPRTDRHHPSTAVDLAALLTSPPAEWEDGTSPVPAPVLERIAADCAVTRVIFGSESQVLDVGRTQRTFAGHLRRAVVARDRQCVIDACGAPAFMSQIHHAGPRWADDGTTRVDHGALVCAFHNQWLEDARVPMRRVVDANGVGRWQTGTPGSYRRDGGGHFPQDDPDHPDHVPRLDAPSSEPRPRGPTR